MRLIKEKTSIDFLGATRRKIALSISVILVLVSLESIFTRGLEFGIDFTGGVLLEVAYAQPANLDEIRGNLEAAGFEDAQAQLFGRDTDVLVRLPPQGDSAEAVRERLQQTLSAGGHLSHGHTASIAGKSFAVQHYGIDKASGQIDYQALADMAMTYRPAMIIAGASSYPRLIDYERMGDIARSVSACLLVDMAHIGGLVAAGVIPSPVPHADFVTFTCYKTMMGGRGGVILAR